MLFRPHVISSAVAGMLFVWWCSQHSASLSQSDHQCAAIEFAHAFARTPFLSFPLMAGAITPSRAILFISAAP
jgi:hypothetical protein